MNRDNPGLFENENCDATHASFRIQGINLIPAEITKILKLAPTYSHGKGDQLKGKSDDRQRMSGMWLISSAEAVKSTSLERHISFLLERLETVTSQIQLLKSDESVEIDFLCYWASRTGHGGPVLSSGVLSRLGALCHVVNFDYYGPYED